MKRSIPDQDNKPKRLLGLRELHALASVTASAVLLARDANYPINERSGLVQLTDPKSPWNAISETDIALTISTA